MPKLSKILPALIFLTALRAFAADANIGYIYPAGAKQGTTIRITAGGQKILAPEKIHISGEGVTAKIVMFGRMPGNLNGDQRKLIEQMLKEAQHNKLAEASGKAASGSMAEIRAARKKAAEEANKPAAAKNPKKEPAKETPPVKLPKIPILFELEDRSPEEIENIKNIIFAPRRMKQINQQLAEQVLIELTVDPDAKPGNRQLRIETRDGLSNPVIFQVGTLDETSELEPNGDTIEMDSFTLKKDAAKPKPNKITLPVTVNGQIYPGDIDQFVFDAKMGQKLVIDTHARSLIPYLADAVPGWFQATIAIFDEKGIELAFTDDYGFNPDPVMFFDVPADGRYELQIKDAIYRGREDFVYRISIGQTPFITSAFPLGARAGSDTRIKIAGRNLPIDTLELDTGPSGRTIRTAAIYKDKLFSNSIPYIIDDLPETAEAASNDTRPTAQPVTIPTIINGTISKSSDNDFYRISAKANDIIVAEVFARRLNSQLDSVIKLIDDSGVVIDFNDDYVLKESFLYKGMVGSITNHADSYLTAKLPKDGNYCIQIFDANAKGGDNFAYRLRISNPIPSFDLRSSTSSIFTKPGAVTPFTVHAMRKDGFDGPIEIEVKDRSSGFTIQSGTIPAGADHVRLTITAPNKVPTDLLDLQLIGKAISGTATITRPLVPADDVMQAFLYRHLVESDKLLVAFSQQKWPMPSFELMAKSPLKIDSGKPVPVKFSTPKKMNQGKLKVKLDAPPEGLSIGDVKLIDGGFEFKMTAAKELIEKGFSGNVIVEILGEYPAVQQKGKPQQQARTATLGYLPAIPVQIAAKKLADSN